MNAGDSRSYPTRRDAPAARSGRLLPITSPGHRASSSLPPKAQPARAPNPAFRMQYTDAFSASIVIEAPGERQRVTIQPGMLHDLRYAFRNLRRSSLSRSSLSSPWRLASAPTAPSSPSPTRSCSGPFPSARRRLALLHQPRPPLRLHLGRKSLLLPHVPGLSRQRRRLRRRRRPLLHPPQPHLQQSQRAHSGRARLRHLVRHPRPRAPPSAAHSRPTTTASPAAIPSSSSPTTSGAPASTATAPSSTRSSNSTATR